MSLQLVSGLLANTGLGAFYQSIASKYSLLSKTPLKIQMRAFACGAVVQGIFMYRCPPQESEGFSKRKAVEVLSPYLLIGGYIAICHRQAFKANIMSTAVLGTIQLAVSQLSPKIVTAPPLMVLRDFDPENIAFGKADWEKRFGDVGDVPPIPEKMAEILNAPCPFNPGKQVGDTHMLVLIPHTVNREPFTLNLLQELIQKHKEKEASRFACYSDDVKNKLGDKQFGKAHWILMTKDVIPGSRNKTYDEQKQLVQDKGEDDYELPRAIEAAVSILMHYFKTDEHLYVKDPWTFTRCQETVTENQWPVAIGGFSVGGSVSPSPTGTPSTSAAWRLSGSSRTLGLGDLEFGNGHWKFDSLGSQRMLGPKLG